MQIVRGRTIRSFSKFLTRQGYGKTTEWWAAKAAHSEPHLRGGNADSQQAGSLDGPPLANCPNVIAAVSGIRVLSPSRGEGGTHGIWFITEFGGRRPRCSPHRVPPAPKAREEPNIVAIHQRFLKQSGSTSVSIIWSDDQVSPIRRRARKGHGQVKNRRFRRPAGDRSAHVIASGCQVMRNKAKLGRDGTSWGNSGMMEHRIMGRAPVPTAPVFQHSSIPALTGRAKQSQSAGRRACKTKPIRGAGPWDGGLLITERGFEAGGRPWLTEPVCETKPI